MKSSQAVIEKWRQIVEAFDRSEMTRDAYCRRIGIKTYQLDYWRRRRASYGIKATSVGPSEWIPVRIREDAQSEAAPPICLRIGRVLIDVRPGFDRELLAEVVRAVESTC